MAEFSSRPSTAFKPLNDQSERFCNFMLAISFFKPRLLANLIGHSSKTADYTRFRGKEVYISYAYTSRRMIDSWAGFS